MRACVCRRNSGVCTCMRVYAAVRMMSLMDFSFMYTRRHLKPTPGGMRGSGRENDETRPRYIGAVRKFRRGFNASHELSRARFARETRRLRRDRKLAKCNPHRPGLVPSFRYLPYRRYHTADLLRRTSLELGGIKNAQKKINTRNARNFRNLLSRRGK